MMEYITAGFFGAFGVLLLGVAIAVCILAVAFIVSLIGGAVDGVKRRFGKDGK